MQGLTSTVDVSTSNALFAEGIENTQVNTLDCSNEKGKYGNLGEPEEHFDNSKALSDFFY